jgi:hypothetical protein
MSILDDNTAVPPPEPHLPEPALPVLPPVTAFEPCPLPTSTVAQPAFSLPAARPAMVRRRRRKRRGLRALVTLVVLGALVGGSYVAYTSLREPEADHPTTPDVATGMSPAGSEPTTTTLVGATVLPVDVQAETDRLFEACKEYIPTGAFVGDPIAVEMWNELDQDPARLPWTCSELLHDDPALAEHMATEMEKIRAEIALHTTTTVSQPTDSRPPTTATVNIGPIEFPTPPRRAPETTCYMMDTNGDGVIDQCVPTNMVD